MPIRAIQYSTPFVVRCVAMVFLGLQCGTSVWSEETTSFFHVLKLEGGNELPGELVDSHDPGVLRWKSPLFQQPLEFPAASISGLERRQSVGVTRATGEFGVHLYSNDILFGDLVGWSAERIRLKTGSYGELSLQTSMIRSIFRWEAGSALTYRGPNRLDEWERSGNANAIHLERGHIVMSQPNTSMDLDARLPDRCRIDIELAWSNRPNFALLLGIGDGPKGKQQCFRVEVWDDSVVLLRELDKRADLALIGKVASFYGELQLSIFLDQSAGRATVVSDVLQGAAEISVTDEVSRSGGRIAIENRGKGLRLKKLDVIRDERFVVRSQSKEPWVQLTDGRTLEGEITGLNVQQGMQMLQFQHGENRIDVPVRDLVRFEVPVAREKIPQRSVRILTKDGTHLTGSLLHVNEQEIRVQSPVIEQPVSFPLHDVIGFMGMFPEKPRGQALVGREGKLSVGSTTIGGHIAAADFTSDQATLAWQPLGALKGTALVQDIVGRIIYREPDVEVKPVQRTIPMRRTTLPKSKPPLTQEPYGRVYLRSGDDVPCNVKSINTDGVVVETPNAPQVKIPHERIKGVAMNTRVGLNLEEAKRMRLLTLPRMQRNNPPTHLVVSRTGDYLRGRLIGLDEQSLTFETRLETLKISRENLSHLIWLHADELLATENKDPVNKIEDQLENPGLPRNKGMFIQTIQRDGGRLTFRPEQLSLRGIMGVSDVLGLCHVQLANVDQILINPPALADPSQSPLASWRLSDAPDPKALKEEKEETGTVPAGTESRLVGQPAPEIRLKQLDDQPFVLSQLRGQIVVLDFWASWCGPCIQLMPKVSNVVAEFEEQQVRLIAVNVEEPKEAVRAMLDRFDYSSQVVLDVDGVAARAYSAEAIPQVVIIDRLGRIARVFVGGGAKFDEQFRTALREVAAP